MKLANHVGLLIFLFTATVTGGRLLWRSFRTGGVPERLLGTTLFVGGTFGYVPLMFVAAGATPDVWTPVLRALGHLGLDIGAFALYAFSASVFRRNALFLVPVAGVALAATWLGLIFSDGLQGRQLGGSPAYWFDFSMRATAYVWVTTETLWHYRGARRRVALGLIESSVANRFLLWGIGMGAVSGMLANAALRNLFFAGHVPAASYVLDGALGTIASVAVWISFFAPRRYLAWSATRASS